MIKIKHINEDDYARIFAFGDMHGSIRLFSLMLKKKNLTKSDLVIILGDSCDRGEDTIGLYQRYIELIKDGYNLLHVLGNHEKMMMDGFFSCDPLEYQIWIKNGGNKMKKSICKRNLSRFSLTWLKNFISDMPHAISSEKAYSSTRPLTVAKAKKSRTKTTRCGA